MAREDEHLRCPHCSRIFRPEEAAPEAEAAARSNVATGETVTIDAFASADSGPDLTMSFEGHRDGSGGDGARSSRRLNDGESGSRRVGQYFGDYKILREVARGGMGIVYLAQQSALRRTVALKVLRAGEGASEEDFSRFMREAEAAASLSHPNIVPIHELNVHDGQPFFTMDYIDGPSLETLIAQREVTPRQSVEILERIALAIDYAHGKGIVHRDLKPANVILARDGTPKITDFGLAVNLARNPASQRMTHSGVVMGTISYIPPEQAAGDVERVGPAADVYSMGAILYEMITGRPPFEGETQFELLHCVLNRDPAPPRKLNPRIPPDLQTICLKCLEKPIWRRYPGAAALAEDCRAFLDGEMIRARPATPWYRLYRLLMRHRLLAGVAAVLLVLMLIFVVRTSSLEEEKRVTAKRLHLTEMVKDETTRKLQRVEAEKDELTAAMDRGWRQLLSDRFSRGKLTDRWVLSTQNVQLWRANLVLHGAGERQKNPAAAPREGQDLPPTVHVALKENYPGDCRLEFKVYVPKGIGGPVGVMLSGTGLNLTGNFGYYFQIGPPSNGGARIDKGPVTLASAPDGVLSFDTWHTVRVERHEKNLLLAVDGQPVVSAVDETILRGDEYGRIGFIAPEGRVYIDDVRVFGPGSSINMLQNMLDMADSFYQNGQLDWAQRMAEHVLRETSDPALRTRALRRCIASYARRYRKNAPTRIDRLIRTLDSDPNYRMQAGEAPFIRGLLALEIRDYPQAVKFFDSAAAKQAAEGEVNRYALLGKLHGVLARIRDNRVDEAVKLLSEMQRGEALRKITEHCKAELEASDTHAVFVTEVDRLLDEKKPETVWSFLEALSVITPESGRELAARCMALARLLNEMDRTQEAMDRLMAAQKLDPEWDEPHLALADTYLQQEREADALTVLERAAQIFPQSLDVHMALASLLLDGSDVVDPETAKRAAERAVELTRSNDPEALHLLGRICLVLDEREQAYECFAAANALNPNPERQKILEMLSPRANSAETGLQPAEEAGLEPAGRRGPAAADAIPGYEPVAPPGPDGTEP